MPVLTIDIAETKNRKLMLERIAKRLDLDSEIVANNTDAAIGTTLGLEFKKPSDFISSIQDGRLFRQAHDLGQYERSAIIVEGNLSDVLYARRGMSVASVIGATYAVSMRQGIPVIFTHPIRTGMFEIHVDAAIRQGIEQGIPDAAFGRQKAKKSDLALAVVSSFPGIGREKASAILTKYGTLAAALADVAHWHEADGIGLKTVASCLEMLSSPYPPQQPTVTV